MQIHTGGPADAPAILALLDGAVVWLVTDRAARGTGVGAALVADALAEARRRGLSAVRVDCYAGDDRRLVAQYQRLGFTPAEAFEVTLDDGRRWPGQVLEIRL
ncbi:MULTISPECIES: GNAT family N-acetyltransferase [unclassified Kitasatospora]|uniref:GNAT family N-acetyltransferase n=1 Tax=unclassified Kitasatospora TaxID=2633591 RepID=UPI00070F5E06|nr:MULTISPECIES: GNAT family N-acetyltransferase [unclassified Kitasatospora]KQV24136.1 hypothetical protein ASC99_02790 [Kitasatospora sp. Root107]KRB67149.1 hypothetical protein ASE03_01950 [Kitasatospora sp. Root187]